MISSARPARCSSGLRSVDIVSAPYCTTNAQFLRGPTRFSLAACFLLVAALPRCEFSLYLCGLNLRMIGLGAALLLASGCGRGDPDAAPGPRPVRVGYLPNLTHAVALLG